MMDAAAVRLGELAPGLGVVCEDYLQSYDREIRQAIERGDGGVVVSARYARILDGLLGSLHCAAWAASLADNPGKPGRVALVAVGGYGRGMVALHSDVDVLFLCDDPSDPRIQSLAEGVLYPLWDLGLSIGHVVRGVEETLALARKDVRTATTLLDMRRVGGDSSIVQDLHRGCRRHVFEPDLGTFIQQLGEDLNERHERYGGSLFLLEPEVKMGRGGVRDIDIAVWAARGRWDCDSTDDFVKAGALLRREVQELDAAREMLWTTRNLLHYRAGRRQDRLTFEDQEEVARRLGFEDGATLGVEQFMQTYYRHARIVAQTAERMLERAKPATPRTKASVVDFGDGTMAFGRSVTLKDTAALKEDPALAFRFYAKVVELGLPPYAFARDAIARIAVDAEWRTRLRESRDAQEAFLQLLQFHGHAPVRRGSIFGELHEVGLMLAMIPEFEAVTGRVQHDVYHVYTVDVHSVAAVDRLHALFRGDLKQSFPLACRLASEAPRPEPLVLGVLLHDVGKAFGKDHSEKGAEMARPIAARLGLRESDQAHVEWLVREHLSLYHWATRRDLSDPETLSEIVDRIGTLERLRDLYLLTFVDVSTTNPNAMTDWKARMFEDLYLRVATALEVPGADLSVGRAMRLREDASQGFVGDPREETLVAFVKSMPDRFILANPVAVIRDQAFLSADREGRPCAVACTSVAGADAFRVSISADDAPGLLAQVTAILAAHRLGVTSAQVYIRPRPGAVDEAVDIFEVKRSSRQDLSPKEVAERLERDLEKVLCGEVTQEQVLARLPSVPKWARRRTPDVPTEVVVDNLISTQFTVVDVFTKDRVGLVHMIARALHDRGISIALSKISTEGDRAADVFYVRDHQGRKVEDPERVAALAKDLKEMLEGESERGESE
ncbi:MAG: [protein-PII] uridylyltransferase [Myxococcales bacterium]|nr:[protein-PII] uridylyltransferase [Myxococcales bacterium]